MGAYSANYPVCDEETMKRRSTPEFKAKVVLEALSGESSQAELCR